jgi:glycosyltransferase involved in cell wall biosynthesis
MAELVSLQASEMVDEGLPVSVVIPLYNEQNILDQNVEILGGFFNAVVGRGRWYFLFIENGSTDKTAALAEAAALRWSPSRVIHLRKPNYGVALKTGLRAATTKWVYIVDIEQWDFPFIAWAWKNREAYDALIASKRADFTICHQHFYRRMLSCALNGLLQVFTQFSGTDTHGPKLLNRISLQSIIAACDLDRGQYDTELVLRAIRAQKRIVEAPSEYRELRPNRNWMVKKIVWNLWALARLTRIMKTVPHQGLARYYRVAREDVLQEAERLRQPAPRPEVRRV